MLYAKIPKEIEEYEAKVLFGLTSRQIKWGALALVLGGTVYFLGHFFISNDILSWLIMLCVAIPFTCGFIPIQGMPADDFFEITMTYIKKNTVPLRYDDGSGREEEYDGTIRKKDRRKFEKERKELKKIGENQ